MKYINRFFNWLGYYKPRAYRLYIQPTADSDWIQVVVSMNKIDASTGKKGCAFDDLCVYESESLELEDGIDDRLNEPNLIYWCRVGDGTIPDLSGNNNNGVIIETDSTLSPKDINDKYGLDGVDER